MTHLVGLAVDHDRAGAADIDGAEFAALQEVVDAIGLAEIDADHDGRRDRHCAANHDAVDVAVSHRQLARAENFRDQEVASQSLCVERPDLVAVKGLADIHRVAPFVDAVSQQGMVTESRTGQPYRVQYGP